MSRLILQLHPRDLRAEVTVLCSDRDVIETNISDLLNVLSNIQFQFKAFESWIKAIDALNEENQLLKKAVALLETRVEDLEQRSRNNNIENVGIPEMYSEKIEEILLRLVSTVGYPVQKSAIDHCYRVHTVNAFSTKPRNIIGKFNSKYIQNNITSASKHFKDLYVFLFFYVFMAWS